MVSSDFSSAEATGTHLRLTGCFCQVASASQQLWKVGIAQISVLGISFLAIIGWKYFSVVQDETLTHSSTEKYDFHEKPSELHLFWVLLFLFALCLTLNRLFPLIILN